MVESKVGRATIGVSAGIEYPDSLSRCRVDGGDVPQ